MHFIPILSTLRRHRTAAALIVLEIALTCAIVCNAIFLIRERIARMDQPSGIAEEEIVRIQITGARQGGDVHAVTAQDLAALHSLPGVKAAALTNMVPFGNSSWNTDIGTSPERHEGREINTAMYLGSAGLLETLGVRLIAGRDFTPDEYADYETIRAQKARLPSVIITRATAEWLYPGQNALGKPSYVWGKEPQIIVGIVEHIARPNDIGGPATSRYAMFLPVTMPYNLGGNYLLRVDPARRAETLAAAERALNGVDPNRIVLKRQLFEEVRHDFFRQDKAMAYLLVGVSIALLIITALGVVGLASFWVQQRTRQIGIRRALGATRGDILRYFQTENFILATLGIVLGMGLAYGINLWLMDKYQVARLPFAFLPIGAGLLWLLGQIAVLGPALRAATIPPAIATRTV